jgi:hypothetical protein
VRQVNDARVQSAGRLAVYVPPRNVAFWNMTRDCRAQPFFIPAMTGVPMLLGLAPHSRALRCELEATYGFGQYGTGSHSQHVEDEALCRMARLRGFEAVLVLESPERASDSLVVSCLP